MERVKSLLKIRLLEAFGPKNNIEVLVDRVTDGLIPYIQSAISTHTGEVIVFAKTKSRAPTSEKMDKLVESIVSQVKVILVAAIEEAFQEGKESVDIKDKDRLTRIHEEASDVIVTETFLEGVIIDLEDEIDSQVEDVVHKRPHSTTAYQASQVMQNIREDVRDSVKRQLKFKNIDIDSTFFETEEYNFFLERFLASIKFDIEAKVIEVKKDYLQKQEDQILSDDFVNKVMDQIDEQLLRRIQRILDRKRPIAADDDNIVHDIVDEVRPVLIQGIRAVVNNQRIIVTEEFYQSQTFHNLINKLVLRITPIIEDEIVETSIGIRQNIEEEPYSVETETVTDDRKEIITDVFSKTTPQIQRHVIDTLDRYPFETDSEIVDRVMVILREIVHQSVHDLYVSPPGSFVRSDVVLNEIVDEIMDKIRPLVEFSVTLYRKDNTETSENEVENIANDVINRVTITIQSYVRTVVFRMHPQGATEDEMLDQVNQFLSFSVSRTLDTLSTKYPIIKNIDTKSEIMTLVLEKAEPIIREEIQKEIQRQQTRSTSQSTSSTGFSGSSNSAPTRTFSSGSSFTRASSSTRRFTGPRRTNSNSGSRTTSSGTGSSSNGNGMMMMGGSFVNFKSPRYSYSFAAD